MTVSVIIPAYNEAPRISYVLQPLIHYPLISQIIVVDDGSTDDTAYLVKQNFPQIDLISYTPNQGKSYAFSQGIKQAYSSIILTLDADLKGLNQKHLDLLIKPVLKDPHTITLTIDHYTFPLYRLTRIDPVSGIRCFNRNHISLDLHTLSQLDSFALEPYFNQLIIKYQLKIQIYNLTTLHNTPKALKYHPFVGILKDLHMISQVMRYYSYNPISFFIQLYQLKKLVIKYQVIN